MAYIKIITHCNYDIYYILEEKSYTQLCGVNKCSFELRC